MLWDILCNISAITTPRKACDGDGDVALTADGQGLFVLVGADGIVDLPVAEITFKNAAIGDTAKLDAAVPDGIGKRKLLLIPLDEDEEARLRATAKRLSEGFAEV